MALILTLIIDIWLHCFFSKKQKYACIRLYRSFFANISVKNEEKNKYSRAREKMRKARKYCMCACEEKEKEKDSLHKDITCTLMR